MCLFLSQAQLLHLSLLSCAMIYNGVMELTGCDQALRGKSDQDSEVLKRHAEGMSGPP